MRKPVIETGPTRWKRAILTTILFAHLYIFIFLNYIYYFLLYIIKI